MTLTVFYVFLIALVGAFLQTNMGFGFPILAMIFLPMLFPFSTAVTLCQVIAIVSTAYLSIRYWKHIRWRILLPLLLVSLVVGAIVTYTSISIQQGLLKMALGLALMILAVFFVWFSNRIKLKGSVASGLTMGAVAGLGNGLFGIGGPPVALYLMACIEDKSEYLATIQAYFLLSNISTILIRAFNGSVGTEHIPLVLFGWLGIGLGTWFGLLSFKKISMASLKRLVYAFVGLSGLWVFVQELLKQVGC
ncbi:MAG: sulfite exporter TauE/SafE family protein [Sphaerochaetaceae bacterium]|nr:sulfite exporter TauE/SafE family protein [Sphaerochaetaceae bacterium]